MTAPRPYADTAWTYRRAGWLGVLPLPARRKGPPPGDRTQSWTGHDGAYPSGPDIQEWADGPQGDGNIGLRMPDNVLGIDVDAYAGKNGASTLAETEATFGPLPATWTSTARRDTDAVSGIRFYRVPAGLRWPGQLGPHVELIQKTHRYAVVWPSVHPDGPAYRWYRPDGAEAERPPAVDELPELPDAWLLGVTGGVMAEDIHSADLTSAECASFLDAHSAGSGCCPPMATTRDRLLAELQVGSSHDALRRLWGLVRLAEQGHQGLQDALDTVRETWLADVTRPGREGQRDVPTARAEWRRSLDGAVRKVVGRPSVDATPPADPCLDPFAAIVDCERRAQAAEKPGSSTAATGTTDELSREAERVTSTPVGATRWEDDFSGLVEPPEDDEPPEPEPVLDEPGQPADDAERIPENPTEAERIEFAARYLLREELARQKARREAKRILDEEEARLLGHVDEETTGGRSSWAPRILDDVLAGVLTEDPPSIGRRIDGRCLFYRGKVNGLLGESESGKTWVALATVAQELLDGQPVLYLDFEDSEIGIVPRLLALGVPAPILAKLFVYVRPEEGLGPAAAAELREVLSLWPYALIVVDGVNAAMTLLGLDLISNTDSTLFTQTLLRPLTRTGAAVITIDHLPKNAENRGKGGVGAQAKRAMVDGCLLAVTAVSEFGRGKEGRLQLQVDKDRPGHVRGYAAYGKTAGYAALVSNGETGEVRIAIEPARTFREQEAGGESWKPTVLMEKVSRFLESIANPDGVSGAAIERNVAGKAEAKRRALDELVTAGYVERFAGPRGASLHRSRAPFREVQDLVEEGPDGA